MVKEGIVVRLMLPEDIQEVCRIEETNFSQPWSEKGFLDALNQENYCFVAVTIDGKIVGYCGMQQVLDEADITNVAVDAQYRNCGIGYRMLCELLEYGTERGITAFTLEVRESNAGAIALYEKLGFVNCGIRKNFYEKPRENAVIMWKR